MDEQTKELCDAIESFDDEVEKIESLLEEGVDPNVQLGDEDDNASLVHKAAAQGTREIVQVLLDAGANPDVQDKLGKTPLHEAARNESNKITSMDAKIVETLLNEGLDPNAKQTEDEEFADGEEETPLHKATQSSGDSARKVVEALLSHGADPNVENKHGKTPLHLASQSADAKVVSALLNEDADPSCTSLEDDSEFSDGGGENTPLHLAAEEGNDGIVGALLEAGANLSAKNAKGKYPIHKAAEEGWSDVVELLLDEGAEADARDDVGKTDVGKTPLHEAASAREQGGFSQDENDPQGTLQALIEAGADADARQTHEAPNQLWGLEGKENTPLHHAVFSGLAENVEALLEQGANPNARNENGMAPLQLASDGEHVEVIRALLEAGADPNVKDEDGGTPLHAAPGKQVAEILLEHGADPNAKNENGGTPLHLASEETIFDDPDAEVVSVLLKEGADPDPIRSGDTPLHVVVGTGNAEIVQSLLEAGADLSMENEDGKVPLHSVSESQVAELLLDNGADPSVRDSSDRTPLHYVLQMKSGEAVKALASLLLEQGADPNAQDEDGFAPLHHVAGNRSNEETGVLASLLLEQGADPNLHSGIAPPPLERARHVGNESVVEALEEAQKSTSEADGESDGNSELHASLLNQARDGNLEAVLDLIERGADPDAMFEAQSEKDEADVSGNVTALLFASWGGHTEIVETLLEAGAEPGRGSINGKTPLAAAAGYGHPDVVESLLEAGADPSASGEDGGPPLGFAMGGGHPEIAERLLDAGADPDCQFSDNDFTLLSYTAVEDKPHMTELLLEAGANPDLVDNDGYTALAYTALSGATEVTRKLLDAGADPSILPGHRSLSELARDKGNPEVADLLSTSQ
jgi:cytohesin